MASFFSAQDLWSRAPHLLLCLHIGLDGAVRAANAAAHAVLETEEGALIGAQEAALLHGDRTGAVQQMQTEARATGRASAYFQQYDRAKGQTLWVLQIDVPVATGRVLLAIKPEAEALRQGLEGMNGVVEAAVSPENRAAWQMERAADIFIQWRGAQDATRGAALQNIIKVHAAADKITGHIAALVRIFKHTEQVPTNMRLQANILEGPNGPISVVSDNHRVMTQQMQAVVRELRDTSLLRAENIIGLGYDMMAAQVLAHIPNQEAAGAASEGEGAPGLEADTLTQLAEICADQRSAADTGVAHIRAGVKRLADICRDLRRQLTGLEMSRMMCEIERAKLNRPAEGLTSIVATLGAAQQRLENEVAQIEAALSDVSSAADAIAKRLNPRDAARPQLAVA